MGVVKSCRLKAEDKAAASYLSKVPFKDGNVNQAADSRQPLI